MSKPLSEMTDDELRAEIRYWSDKIETSFGWGAAMTFALECRDAAERALQERNKDAV